MLCLILEVGTTMKRHRCVLCECTCAGRSQFRRGGLCGRCLVGAGAQQLHIVGWKPTYLALFPPGLNQSKHTELLVRNYNQARVCKSWQNAKSCSIHKVSSKFPEVNMMMPSFILKLSLETLGQKYAVASLFLVYLHLQSSVLCVYAVTSKASARTSLLVW